MKLAILSCWYEQPERATVLRESCAHFGLPLIECGAGNWPGNHRRGKLEVLYDKLLSLPASGYTHILWADAFDSVVVASEAKILSRYRDFRSPFVFSVETNCWPEPEMERLYPPNPNGSDYRYINSGGWMGQIYTVGDFLGALISQSPCDQEFSYDDQYLWSQAYLEGLLTSARLDYGSSIFRTMWQQQTCSCLPESEIGDTCVVHYNGASLMTPLDGYHRMAKLWEDCKHGPIPR